MMSLFDAKNRLELLALAVASGIVNSEYWPLRPSGKLSLESLDLLRSPDGGSFHPRYDGAADMRGI